MTDLVHGGLVPGGVDGEVGHEERETTGESLGSREATVGRPREGGEPHVEVSEVLRALGPQHLQQTHGLVNISACFCDCSEVGRNAIGPVGDIFINAK